MRQAVDALQLELPRLSRQILAEAVMSLPLNDAKSRSLVNVAGRVKFALRPQHDFLVSRLPREPDAFAYQPTANPQPMLPASSVYSARGENSTPPAGCRPIMSLAAVKVDRRVLDRYD